MAQTKRTTLNRRNFLLAVSAGGAATVAAALNTSAAKTTSQAQPAATGTGKRSTRGYSASEHINNYYRTTKV
jgi:hypothetical protein